MKRMKQAGCKDHHDELDDDNEELFAELGKYAVSPRPYKRLTARHTNHGIAIQLSFVTSQQLFSAHANSVSDILPQT